MSNEQHALDLSDAHILCEAAVNYVLQNVNTVQYIIKGIEEITQKVFPRERIKCLKMASTSSLKSKDLFSFDSKIMDRDCVYAGYMWRPSLPDCEKGDIVLIEDNLILNQTCQKHIPTASEEKRPNKEIMSRKDYKNDMVLMNELERNHENVLNFVERNLRHELIHAFDDARGHIDSSDCFHQACSEVRAAHLSGDCFASEELKRGRFDYLEGGLKCVQRRARMALETNPICRGFSKRAVETVFRRCYADYEPFAAPIYAMGSYGERRFKISTPNQSEG